jgi:hypothetical protein
MDGEQVCFSSQQRLWRVKRFWVLWVFLISSVMAQDSMLHYCNARFAFCIDYPSALRVQTPPDNGDGRTFKSPDGQVTMLVYGSYNSLQEKLETRFRAESTSSATRKVSYRFFKPDRYAISGLENGKVFYEKILFKDDTYKTFLISYPASLKKRYDPITAALAASFVHSQ